MLKIPALLALPLAALAAFPAVAQSSQQGPDDSRIKQVIVYGDDPCPISQADEILVCARQDEKERYRIPQELRREEIGSTKNEAWTSRVRSIEYVGAGGTQTCSPVGGANSFTGCFSKLAKQAKAERAAMGDKSWADLVAAERAKRLGTIDADSDEIEARVKAEEKAKAEAAAKAAEGTEAK
ncbi:hypothetical protein [Sphingobium fluviale]|uniref:Uncharacterized protein n=1 Tax=Sphingobium fluviale TaxID=2506423 RepID=A0A4Q1KI66_9SPHN|nr:hypothetical protein [Sphingobium fluviale]RXR29488.1 hypothetical protein EQG66_05930 [Sphingobium fluviale]